MKSQKALRFLSALLVLLMLSASFSACGTGGNNDDTAVTTAASDLTDPGEVTDNLYDDEGYRLDEIPADIDLKNAELKILYWEDVENHEFPVFESNGDMVDEAILTANIRAEERLKVKLEYIPVQGNNDHASIYLSKVQTAFQGGEGIDIYAAYSKTLGTVAANGYCQNLLNYDDKIDFDMPWWPDALIEEATIQDKLYFCAGDLSTNLPYMMYVLFFNKDQITNFSLDNPYELVEKNEWTFEKMFEMCSGLTDPTSSEAVYGLLTGSKVHLDPFFYAAGLHTTERGSDGFPIISPSFSGEKVNDVVNVVWNFLNSGTASFAKTTNVYEISPDTVFHDGHGLFSMQRARFASEKLADASFDYGIIPVPKYNAEQDHFATCMAFPFTLYGIANGAKNEEAAAWVLECLSSIGHRTITPAVYEISMKERYARDAESARMLDVIRAGATFEIGRLYADDFGKYTYSLFRNAVSSDTKPDYASAYKGASRMLDMYLKNLLKSFS